MPAISVVRELRLYESDLENFNFFTRCIYFLAFFSIAAVFISVKTLFAVATLFLILKAVHMAAAAAVSPALHI